MRIQHNIAALNSYRNYTNNTNAVSKNLEKLSSGYRINRAGDDAAGLAISEKMRAQITGLETAQKNASDGVSLVQTAEGALTEVHSMLNRMVELADQSANGTYQDTTDRTQLQKEVDQLKEEIDRISEATNFNGLNLLDGSMVGGATVDFTFGTTNLTASLGQKSENVLAAAAKIKVSANDGAAPGIEVTFDNQGAVEIKLGTQGANSVYSAKDIEKAVRAAAAAKGAGAAANSDNEKIAKAYAGFKLSGNDIHLKAGDQTAMQAGSAFTAGTGEGLKLQIGDTAEAYNQLSVSISSMDSASLGINALTIATQEDAGKAVKAINDAINMVSDVRGTLGATQNRLEHTINNLSVTTENMTAAESRIRDVDVAKEMMAYTKNNILVQSAQAMLAQANQTPQGVLQLLQ